ncbi:MAG: right-handed parallel beta-helix repeat-containing protein [Planctomycetota bacterium]
MKYTVVAFICLLAFLPCEARVITVDDDGPADFHNIQAAINDSNHGDIIIVNEGLYVESINFMGKNIVVTSTDPGDWSVVSRTVIGSDSRRGEGNVRFRGTEDPDCLLTGFEINGGVVGSARVYGGAHTLATIDRCILRGNRGRCVIRECDGLISNCLVVGNGNPYLIRTAVSEAAIDECCGVIKNCTVADNLDYAIFAQGSACSLRIENCIIQGSTVSIGDSMVDIRFSNIEGGAEGVELWGGSLNWGPGNIDVDPCFVMLGRWNAIGTPGAIEGGFWVPGDYHLKSEGWRWDRTRERWRYDGVTSRCIDAGNPGSPLGDEALTLEVDPLNRFGQNLRIDMGAYGGTAEASMPPYYWGLLADVNNDGIVDYVDVRYYFEHWLDGGNESPADLDRNGTVDLADCDLLREDCFTYTSWHHKYAFALE